MNVNFIGVIDIYFEFYLYKKKFNGIISNRGTSSDC